MNFNFEKYNVPFDHYIVDNFLPDDIAKSISNDFLDYENQKKLFESGKSQTMKSKHLIQLVIDLLFAQSIFSYYLRYQR